MSDADVSTRTDLSSPQKKSKFPSDCHFNKTIAALYGIPEALILGRIYWSVKNHEEKNKTQFLINSKWVTHQTAKGFSEVFPFLSSRTIERAIKKLRDAGFIETWASKVKNKKTNFYAVNEDLIHTICRDQNFETDKMSDLKPTKCRDHTDKMSVSFLCTRVNESIYESQIGGGEEKSAYAEPPPGELIQFSDLQEKQISKNTPPTLSNTLGHSWYRVIVEDDPETRFTPSELNKICDRASEVMKGKYEFGFNAVLGFVENEAKKYLRDKFFKSPKDILKLNQDGISFLEEACEKLEMFCERFQPKKKRRL